MKSGTTDIVTAFREPLETLERDRLKAVRDRKGFAFLAGLLFFLSTVCFVTALITAPWLDLLALLLFVAAFSARRLRARIDDPYQFLFRERITRSWFHSTYPDAYLAAPSGDVTDTEYFLVEEACRSLLRFSLKKTSLEDRIYFEREPAGSHVLILSSGSSRALLFAKRREGGEIGPVPNELVSALSRYGKPRVHATSEGVWIALALSHRPFPAPVEAPSLDPASYASWSDDAKILLDPEVRALWLAIR